MSGRQYVFAQFLNLLPRYDFQRIVNKYNGDYRTKHFKCWNQMACMIFAHIRQEDSLRDIDCPKRSCRQIVPHGHPTMSKIYFGRRE